MSADPDLARRILEDAGCDPARIRVEEKPRGIWLVAARELGAGCSSPKEEAFDTPQEVAAHLVSRIVPLAIAGANDPGDIAIEEPTPEFSATEANNPIEDESWIGPEMLEAEGQDAASDGYDSKVEEITIFAEENIAKTMFEAVISGESPHERESPEFQGVMLLPDELGALRNHVRGLISEEKLIRLDALADVSRRDFLAQAFSDYQNAGALGLEITPTMRAGYEAYLELSYNDAAITSHALRLERTARDADAATLRAMAANIWAGGA